MKLESRHPDNWIKDTVIDRNRAGVICAAGLRRGTLKTISDHYGAAHLHSVHRGRAADFRRFSDSLFASKVCNDMGGSINRVCKTLGVTANLFPTKGLALAHLLFCAIFHSPNVAKFTHAISEPPPPDVDSCFHCSRVIFHCGLHPKDLNRFKVDYVLGANSDHIWLFVVPHPKCSRSKKGTAVPTREKKRLRVYYIGPNPSNW